MGNPRELLLDTGEVIPKAPSQYELLSPKAYMADLTAEAQRAQKRIWIKAMAIEYSPYTAGLFQAMTDKDQEGLDVRIAYDAYTDYRSNDEFHVFHPHTPRAVMRDMRQRRASVVSELTANDVEQRKFVVTNRPTGILKKFPGNVLYGRDHIKIDIVDDTAWLKGINLIPNMDRTDFAIKTTNPRIVEGLAAVFDNTFSEEKNPQDGDYFIACDENNTIMVDSGRRGQSAIMDTVLSLTEAENEGIVVATQFLSKGRFVGALNRAHDERHVPVDFFVGPLKLEGKALTAASGLVAGNLFTSPHFNIHEQSNKLHAKLILFKGQGVAVAGTHCFEELFVRLGTEEVALMTTQPELISKLSDFTADLTVNSKFNIYN